MGQKFFHSLYDSFFQTSSTLSSTLLDVMHTSLAAIGRLQPVESEEPPINRPSLVNPASSALAATGRTDSFYSDVTDDSENIDGLRHFPTLAPEDIRELVEKAELRFSFLPGHQTALSRGIDRVRLVHAEVTTRTAASLYNTMRLEQRLHWLELVRQIATRLQDFEELAKQVDRLQLHECQILESCKLDKKSSSSGSRLVFLRALCDSLRLCLNQAGTLRSSIEQDPACQRMVVQVRTLMCDYMHRYHLLGSRAMLATHHLIETGLLVLSYSNLTQYTHDDLWEISRGIEEYNILLEDLQQVRRVNLHRYLLLDTDSTRFGHLERSLDRVDLLKTVSFSKILFKLASERSLRIVGGVHAFFHTSEDLLSVVKFNQRELTLPVDDMCNDPLNPILVDGVISRLVQNGFPLNDFLRIEYEFASGFVDIISQSTEMLKQLQNPGSTKRLQKSETLDTFIAPTAAVSTDTTTLQPPARKGVQWSDHKEVSVRHHVISRYLELVWQQVDRQMSHHLGPPEETDNDMLCSYLLLSPEAKLFLARIMAHPSTKELFPPGLIPTLRSQSTNIRMNAVLSIWDQGLSQILKSGTTDGMTLCETSMEDGSRTCTTRLCAQLVLIMSPIVRHIHAILDEMHSPTSNAYKPGPTIAVSRLSIYLSLITHLLRALLTTFGLPCTAAGSAGSSSTTTSSPQLSPSDQPPRQHHLWNRPISELHLVLHADLPLIADRMSRLLERYSRASCFKRPTKAPLITPVEALYRDYFDKVQEFNSMQCHIQCLSRSLAAEFTQRCIQKATQLFMELMPSRSFWRRPSLYGPSAQHSTLSSSSNGQSSSLITGPPAQRRNHSVHDYAKAVVTALLTEVVSGVARLPSNRQIEAVRPVVASLCIAWKQHIFDSRIQFSLWGASHLENDVKTLHNWIGMFVASEPVRAALLLTPELKDFETGVHLLLDQPSTSSQSKPAVPNKNPVSPSIAPYSSSNSNSNSAVAQTVSPSPSTAHAHEWLLLRATHQNLHK